MDKPSARRNKSAAYIGLPLASAGGARSASMSDKPSTRVLEP